jgi:hypothetical protein
MTGEWYKDQQRCWYIPRKFVLFEVTWYADENDMDQKQKRMDGIS